MSAPDHLDRTDSTTALLEDPSTDAVLESSVATLPDVADRPEVASPSSKPAAKKSSRYQSLDMWRGAACLMLVMYHATFYAEHTWRSGDSSTWTLGGLAVNLIGRLWIGVPIFFVVSGYCIAASSDAARRPAQSLRTYFARRFRRIYPPLWIACALCVGFVLLVTISESIRQGCVQLPALAEFTAGKWLGNLTATEAWLGQVNGSEPEYLMKNTWTLCYEEQFYAVVGLMLLAGGRRFFAASALIAAATLAVRHASRAVDGSLQGFFCDGHWLLFAIGILVYYRLHHAPRHHRWTIVGGLAAVVVYAVTDYRLSSSAFEKHLDEYLVVAAGFGLLLIGLYRLDGWITTRRWLQPLFSYGKMSYSVYLTHFPVVVVTAFVLSQIGSKADWFVALVTVPLSVAISIPLGRAFHLAVERRFMNAPLDARRTAVVEAA